MNVVGLCRLVLIRTREATLWGDSIVRPRSRIHARSGSNSHFVHCYYVLRCKETSIKKIDMRGRRYGLPTHGASGVPCKPCVDASLMELMSTFKRFYVRLCNWLKHFYVVQTNTACHRTRLRFGLFSSRGFLTTRYRRNRLHKGLVMAPTQEGALSCNHHSGLAFTYSTGLMHDPLA